MLASVAITLQYLGDEFELLETQIFRIYKVKNMAIFALNREIPLVKLYSSWPLAMD